MPGTLHALHKGEGRLRLFRNEIKACNIDIPTQPGQTETRVYST